MILRLDDTAIWSGELRLSDVYEMCHDRPVTKADPPAGSVRDYCYICGQWSWAPWHDELKTEFEQPLDQVGLYNCCYGNVLAPNKCYDSEAATAWKDQLSAFFERAV